MALPSAGSPSSDSCPGLSNGEEVGPEKPSLEPQKSLGEDGLPRGPDALGSADREDEEEEEEEEEQTDPKKPTTDEVSPVGGKRQRKHGLVTLVFAEHLCAGP